MMGEAIVQMVIEPILKIIIDFIAYFTARFLLPVLSFGSLSVAPAPTGKKIYPRWHGFDRTSDNKIVVHEEMAALLGLLFWLGLVAIGSFCYVIC